MTTAVRTHLATLEGRCTHGYDLATQHGTKGLCQCTHVPALKAEGIGRANDHAPDDVKRHIDRAIRTKAATGQHFSANDLRVELNGIAGPVVGGRFTALSNAGVITPTGERVASNLGSTHGHEIKVWRAA